MQAPASGNQLMGTTFAERWEHFGQHSSGIPGPRVIMFPIKKERSEIAVDYVKRVGNPRGSAGHMLAEAIRAGGNARPVALSAPNSDRVIENLFRQGVDALGGRVPDIHTGIDPTGKHWIRVWVRYS